jgi:hypothetical protein
VDERCKFLSGSSMKDFVKFVKFVVCLNRVLPNFAVEPNNNQTDASQGRFLIFTEFIYRIVASRSTCYYSENQIF